MPIDPTIFVATDPTMLVATLAALAGGLVAGALAMWLATRSAQFRLRTELETTRAVHAERLRAYGEAETRLRDAFQSLSVEALASNNRAFLDLAEVRLREARSESITDIDARKKAIEDLLAPLSTTLEQIDRSMQDAERRRVESGSALLQRIASLDAVNQNLRAETSRLVDALKRPGVRGRWGELQLKRVVELAGMVEHCDFEEQMTLTGRAIDEDLEGRGRRVRPDVIIRLPGGKHLVVDAKVPLDAYLRALEAPDEVSRQALLADHARQVRAHLLQLGGKRYFADVQSSPEFVVMFLPGEMFFSAALEQDPALIEFGVERKVIPASPTTLIALLRAVAYGWQQEAVGENARRISDLGRSLYDAVRTLGGHFDALGGRLKSTLEAYNQAVGSLEGNVLVRARKLKDFYTANGVEEITTLEPLDRVPRVLQARELTDGLPFTDTTDLEATDPAEFEHLDPAERV